MVDLREAKQAARKAAFARRKTAQADVDQMCRILGDYILELPGETVSGYWPIRTEADPRAALHRISKTRNVVLPVVDGQGLPLSFRRWTPDAEMIEGAYGAAIPACEEGADPDILIVPLAGFDARGFRLGYGGGFYDRTLEKLRSVKPTLAVGFAYEVQGVETLPVEDTDQALDFIVTETGVRAF